MATSYTELDYMIVRFKKIIIYMIRKVFQKELIIEDSLPIPPYTQHHLLWMKTGLWCGWWWFILLAP